MEVFITILIFLFILFLYIHVADQYKKSEDLEIYEMDYQTNKQLQEVCNIKQPILFEFQTCFPNIFETLTMESLEKSGATDVRVKDTNDYFSGEYGNTNVDYITLPMASFRGLATTDTNAHYFTEENVDFINESGLYMDCEGINMFLKPEYTAKTTYDFILGSKNSELPLRYHKDYRRFFVVTSGKMRVKMAPWKYHKLLNPVTDYENLEFWSPMNPWNPQPKYKTIMERVKFLEIDVVKGYILYVPPYWWYSIQFTSEEDTVVFSAKYNSLMNIVSNLPDYARYFMQYHRANNSKETAISGLDSEKKESEDSKVETVTEGGL